MTTSACSCCTSSSYTGGSGTLNLASEQIVEIAERLEEQEHVPVDGVESELSATSSEDDTALTDLDKVVHAAVASAQTEAEADSNRER